MNWRKTTLGEVCDEVGGIIQTGPFGSQLHESDYSSEGIPVVMPKDIVEGRIATNNVARVSTTHVERLSRHKLRRGDIVYGRRGDIGRQALIRQDQEGWMCGTGCLRLSFGESVLNPVFLHYYLRQDDVISWITNQAVGATMPNLNTGILRTVPVRFPPLPLQRRIASTLSPYDDLIENNTRRIQILEQMARSLYREWFVDFRSPGYAKFKLVESPLGMIPQGWKVVPVPEAVFINPTTTVPREGVKPFVPMTSLATGSTLITDIESREGNSGSKFRNGDTLFARITPCLENGKTALVEFSASDDDVAFGSTEFIVMRSRSVTPEYVYLLARSQEFRENAIKSMTGATGRQRVQEACFNKFLIAHPDLPRLEQFTEAIRPMFELIHCLSNKNANLRRTRDLLLPKLMSGAFDVSKLDITNP